MRAIAIAETSLAPSVQRVFFAGRPILFRTGSPRLAMCAAEFFGDGEPETRRFGRPRASITIHVREMDGSREDAPLFRARGHFARARFTRADSFWFNLRTREISGECSAELAEDSRRWRAHIFPSLLGILSAAIGVAPLHAACVVRKGRGILLAGHSGTGKSTLTVALARRGHALLSDDWTYLAANEGSEAGMDLRAWGLPVPVKLLPDAVTFFPQLRNLRAGISLNGELAYEFWPEERFEISRCRRCFVNTVVLLERAEAQGCRLARIDPGEAVQHLQAEIEPLEGMLADSYKRQLGLIERAVEGASCYRYLFNGHPEKVAEALDESLQSVA